MASLAKHTPLEEMLVLHPNLKAAHFCFKVMQLSNKLVEAGQQQQKHTYLITNVIVVICVQDNPDFNEQTPYLCNMKAAHKILHCSQQM